MLIHVHGVSTQYEMADCYHKLILDGATYFVPCKNILTFAK
jgi:hypothetical protein